MKRYFDKTFVLYVVLGFVNYIVCSAIMLFFNNVLRLDEDPSMIVSFALQTINSFILNRYVTFRGIRIAKSWPVKFVISVAISYLFSKVLMKGVYAWLIERQPFSGIADRLQDLVAKGSDNFRTNLVMLACTFTYCVVNYIGQRYFVFKARKQDTCNP